jgi:uncharacterized protein YkwD
MAFLKLIPLFLLFSTIGSAQSLWKEKYYKQYNYRSIEGFGPIQKAINPDEIDYSLLNAAIFFETNKQRVTHHCKVLMYSSKLENCAQEHSHDMVKYNFFDHYSIVQGKHQLRDRAKKAGIEGSEIGENISNNYILQLNDQSYYPPS